MNRFLHIVTPIVTQVFSIIGMYTCVALVGSYLNSAGQAPRYTGKIYDCRQNNGEAFLAVCRLMGQGNYQPSVSIYQYPDDAATMITLNSEADRVNFIFLAVPIQVRVVNGKPPAPTPPLFSFVQK